MYLGFGLHVGWAIEGAIGSNYKIDASYLSPNVNLVRYKLIFNRPQDLSMPLSNMVSLYSSVVHYIDFLPKKHTVQSKKRNF